MTVTDGSSICSARAGLVWPVRRNCCPLYVRVKGRHAFGPRRAAPRGQLTAAVGALFGAGRLEQPARTIALLRTMRSDRIMAV